MTSPPPPDQPSWKTSFLSKPSISLRKCIADVYNPPYEDTSTLVLTSSSGKFIDIRFPLTQHHTSLDKSLALPLKAHASYWAFSGTSVTTFYDSHGDDGSEKKQPGMEYVAHTVFTHDIDTRGKGIVDEGDSWVLPDGDVIEVGVWADTGRLYKEVWTEPVARGGEGVVRKRPVVVAETRDGDGMEVGRGRGIMLRIGDYVQGIYEGDGGEVIVVRMSWVFEHGGSGGRWVVDERSDGYQRDELPCDMLTQNTLELGSEFKGKGLVWVVTEFEAE